MTSSAPFLASGRPQIKVDGQRAERLEADLIRLEARADAILNQVLNNGESWITELGAPPKDERAAATWRRHARTVAAYRDRYRVTGSTALGAPQKSTAGKLDTARANAALEQARDLSRRRETTSEQQVRREAAGLTF